MYKEEGDSMGMTDRQFDAYQAELLENLKTALELTPDNHLLRKLVERIEGQLQRP